MPALLWRRGAVQLLKKKTETLKLLAFAIGAAPASTLHGSERAPGADLGGRPLVAEGLGFRVYCKGICEGVL